VFKSGTRHAEFVATRRTDHSGSLQSADRPSASIVPASRPPWSEDGEFAPSSPTPPDPILLEFDRLFIELRPRRPRDPRELPLPIDSPYLEERLALAQARVASLAREVAALDPPSPGVALEVGSLGVELDSARRELDFLRGNAGAPAAPFLAPGASPVYLDGPPTPSTEDRGSTLRESRSRWGRQGVFPPPGAVAEFTVGRYNRTIARLKARRRRLAVLTLALAAGVSVLLVAWTLSFREAPVPLWIELLPAIWLVSVPFFIFSFRGTQRVLRRNHLELEG
jgi:hypothetical protein